MRSSAVSKKMVSARWECRQRKAAVRYHPMHTSPRIWARARDEKKLFPNWFLAWLQSDYGVRKWRFVPQFPCTMSRCIMMEPPSPDDDWRRFPSIRCDIWTFKRAYIAFWCCSVERDARPESNVPNFALLLSKCIILRYGSIICHYVSHNDMLNDAVRKKLLLPASGRRYIIVQRLRDLFVLNLNIRRTTHLFNVNTNIYIPFSSFREHEITLFLRILTVITK